MIRISGGGSKVMEQRGLRQRHLLPRHRTEPIGCLHPGHLCTFVLFIPYPPHLCPPVCTEGQSEQVKVGRPTLPGLLRFSNLAVLDEVAVLGQLLIGQLEGQGCDLGLFCLDSS